MEVWKDIEDLEGLYQISTHGNVRSMAKTWSSAVGIRSKKETLLKPGNMGGYLRVVLCRDGVKYNKAVHRLVAEAFIPNPEGKKEVNHKDGDKLNNHVDNLEWVTRSENTIHAFENGLMNVRRGESHDRSRKVINIDTGVIYVSATEAARKEGINRNNLSAWLTGRVSNKSSLRYL